MKEREKGGQVLGNKTHQARHCVANISRSLLGALAKLGVIERGRGGGVGTIRSADGLLAFTGGDCGGGVPNGREFWMGGGDLVG